MAQWMRILRGTHIDSHLWDAPFLPPLLLVSVLRTPPEHFPPVPGVHFPILATLGLWCSVYSTHTLSMVMSPLAPFPLAWSTSSLCFSAECHSLNKVSHRPIKSHTACDLTMIQFSSRAHWRLFYRCFQKSHCWPLLLDKTFSEAGTCFCPLLHPQSLTSGTSETLSNSLLAERKRAELFLSA